MFADRPELCPPLTPVQKLHRFARLMLRPAAARKLATLATCGYLAETGWVRSVVSGEVVDRLGQPQPWATFPFIAFLAPRLRTEWTVFEYGAGASTLFYATRVRRVVSVDDNPDFVARLAPRLPANAHVAVHPAASAAYLGAIESCVPAPEIVCVDGNDRVRCVSAAIPRLHPGGVVVLDDAERPEYAPARHELASRGFRSVEFWGLAPGIVTQKCTAVYYRPENVLGL